MRAKIIAPARREFLKEVGYYNEKALGLGAALIQEVENATARALAFPAPGLRLGNGVIAPIRLRGVLRYPERARL